MKKLVITRSLRQGKKFADKVGMVMPLLAHDDIILEPLLDIRPMSIVRELPKSYDAIILTSVNAIPAVLEYGDYSKPLYCVGEATAEVAREQGISNIKAVASTVADLISHIQKEPKKLHFCYFRGKHVSEDMTLILNAQKHKVDEYICYDAVAADCLSPDFTQVIKNKEGGVLVFFSKRTVSVFIESVLKIHNIQDLGHLKILCLSESMLKLLPQSLQKNAYSAKTPDANAMLDLIRVHLV